MFDGLTLPTLVDAGGWIVLGVLLAIGGVIPRWTHTKHLSLLERQLAESRTEAARWRDVALSLLGTNEKAVSALEAVKDVAQESERS